MNGRVLSIRLRSVAILVVAGLATIAPARSPDPAPGGEQVESTGWTMEANGVRVEITATPAAVVVGDSVMLTLDVLAPAGVTVELPVIEDTLDEFTVLARDERPDVPDGADRRWQAIYELATFAAGATEIPAFEITIRDGSGVDDDRTIATGPIALEVRSVLTERESELLDVADPVRIGTLARGLLLAFAGLLAVLLAVGAWAFFVLRARRLVLPVVPPLPAHVRALLALDTLEEERLPSDGRVHEFFVRVSDIVRHYVEERFGLPAVEQTTGEFLQSARRDPRLSAEHRAGLETFLRAADMVKFAKHRPAPEECDEALASAREFIETTAERKEAMAA